MAKKAVSADSDDDLERANAVVTEVNSDTRERILAAATSLFISQGYSATSIAQISKASSAHAASIYWAFRNKEGILAAVIDHESQNYYRVVRDGLVGRSGLKDIITGLTRPLSEGYAFTSLVMLLMLERKAGDPTILAAATRVRQTALEMLEAMFSELEEFKHEGAALTPRIMARHTLMIFDGLFVARQIGPGAVDLEEFLKIIAFNVTALVRAVGEGEPL